VVACYLAALVALGGGGSPAPLAELACELLAVIALGLWLAGSPILSLAPPKGLIALTVLALAVPLFQLVPLPAAVWQAMPGRASMTAALDLVGASDDWRPLSVSPHRTLAALLSLGPPLAMLWFAALGTGRELRLLVIAAAVMSLTAVVVGAGQLAQGPSGWLDFYATGDSGVLHGFNANRNTAADILLIGLTALAAVWSQWPAGQRRTASAAFVGIGALLLLAVLLTGSRTGIAMIPLATGFAVAIIRTRPGASGGLRGFGAKGWACLAGTGFAAGAALWWWREVPALARVLARFDFSGEFRPELWRDAWFAAGHYWPIGSGLGTFLPAMLPAERLEVVDQTLPNRAHNELLELAIEGGLPLMVCWAAIVMIVLWSLRQALAPDSRVPRAYALFASAVIAIAALHSLVDYPLRSMAMAGLVAMSVGIVLSAASRASHTVEAMADGRQ
jgi:O-antigen ligase